MFQNRFYFILLLLFMYIFLHIKYFPFCKYVYDEINSYICISIVRNALIALLISQTFYKASITYNIFLMNKFEKRVNTGILYYFSFAI